LPGVVVPSGCRVTHGTAASIKTPFTFTPVTMHELDPGVGGRAYRGQFGFIPFQAGFRLPRHVHIEERDGREARLVAERILVVNGIALTELNGAIHVVAPGTLVENSPSRQTQPRSNRSRSASSPWTDATVRWRFRT